jgi:hypothetical protein
LLLLHAALGTLDYSHELIGALRRRRHRTEGSLQLVDAARRGLADLHLARASSVGPAAPRFL